MKQHIKQEGQQFYLWDWVGGGYNTAWADSLEDATKIANEMCTGKDGSSKLVPCNVRLSDSTERNRYDSAYSMD